MYHVSCSVSVLVIQFDVNCLRCFFVIFSDLEPCLIYNVSMDKAIKEVTPYQNKTYVGMTSISSRNALRRDVVLILVSSLFRGGLPAGTRLVIRKLAEQFGISTTPVREALVELEAVGVVEFIHNRGAVVKPFGAKNLREIYHMRRILEAEAVRCACGHIPADRLQEIKKRLLFLRDSQFDETSTWSDQVVALDRQLHELIVKHCDDERLAAEIHRYNGLMQTIRDIVGNQRQAQQRGLEEHLSIVNALLLLESEKAAMAMSQHVNSTSESAEVVMFPPTFRTSGVGFL